MKRKAYVRVTERIITLANPIEVIAGVELKTFYTLDSQYQKLRDTLKTALWPTALNNYSDESLAAAVELAILNRYPTGTTYFIEVGRGNLDQYVQVFETGD